MWINLKALALSLPEYSMVEGTVENLQGSKCTYKPMAYKFMYIPNDDTQNYYFCG